MEGYKTWTGLAITLLGIIGVGNVIGNDTLASIVNTIGTLAGLLIAAYGNYKAHKKIAELKS